VKHKSKPFRLY